jgi:membrane fusion protein (multidrug efflux system)
MQRTFQLECHDFVRLSARSRFSSFIRPLLLLGAFAFGCDGKPQAAKPPPTDVEIVAVQQADVPVYGRWVGTLVGYVNADIRGQVTGYLLSQDYQEGEFVHKRDLLFQIDPRPFKAALDQAKGRLGQAKAQLGKTDLDVKRYTPLAANGAVSKEDLDNAVQANLSAQADVEAAEAAVELAQVNLDFTRVVSPIDGIAGLVNAQVGDLVGPAGPLLTTVSTVDPIKAIFTVSEQEYINFRHEHPGAQREAALRKLKLELILADGSTYPQTGKWGATQREVGIETGALQIQGIFPNPDNFLRPGQFARVQTQLSMRKGALVVPQRAVAQVQGADQVDVVDSQNKVHVVPVEVGERIGLNCVIEKGLKPNDRVVVEGVQKVREGMEVNPRLAQVTEASTKPATTKPATMEQKE